VDFIPGKFILCHFVSSLMNTILHIQNSHLTA